MMDFACDYHVRATDGCFDSLITNNSFLHHGHDEGTSARTPSYTFRYPHHQEDLPVQPLCQPVHGYENSCHTSTKPNYDINFEEYDREWMSNLDDDDDESTSMTGYLHLSSPHISAPITPNLVKSASTGWPVSSYAPVQPKQRVSEDVQCYKATSSWAEIDRFAPRLSIDTSAPKNQLNAQQYAMQHSPGGTLSVSPSENSSSSDYDDPLSSPQTSLSDSGLGRQWSCPDYVTKHHSHDENKLSSLFDFTCYALHGNDDKWMKVYIRLCQPFIEKHLRKALAEKSLSEEQLVWLDLQQLRDIWRVAHRRWHSGRQRRSRRKSAHEQKH